MVITRERLIELLNYDPETGVFTNRVFRRKCPIGKNSGNVRKDGYVSICIDKKQYLAHRLAWLYHYGQMPECIDHIDCNPSNNRISNLRVATMSQNQHNNRLRRDNTSGIKGVAWDNERQKWLVVIGIRNKSVFIGRFDDLEEAGAAAIAARERLHGEFARHARLDEP